MIFTQTIFVPLVLLTVTFETTHEAAEQKVLSNPSTELSKFAENVLLHVVLHEWATRWFVNLICGIGKRGDAGGRVCNGLSDPEDAGSSVRCPESPSHFPDDGGQ